LLLGVATGDVHPFPKSGLLAIVAQVSSLVVEGYDLSIDVAMV